MSINSVACITKTQAHLHGQMNREEWVREYIAPEFELGLLTGPNIEQVVDGVICSDKEDEFYSAIAGIFHGDVDSSGALIRLLSEQAEIIALPLAEAEAKRREELAAEDNAYEMKEAG